MDTRKMLGPDDYDRIKGWRVYEVTCDDPGLSKPAFLAAKSAEAQVQGEVAALDRYLEVAVARQSLGSCLDGSPLVLVGRDRRAEPRFEPGVDAARNAAVDDLAEAPVRSRERQERERDQRGDQLELEASHGRLSRFLLACRYLC